eukprot:1086161_1
MLLLMFVVVMFLFLCFFFISLFENALIGNRKTSHKSQMNSVCPHVNFHTVDTLSCGKKILKPNLWYCHHDKCSQLNPLFACLTCGYISCVDLDHEGHAEDHCYSKRRTKHPIAIDIYSHTIWCFLCEKQISIHHDSIMLSMQDFAASLQSLQPRHVPPIQSDGVVIVSSTKTRELEDKDKLDNASAHYEMMLLRKIFTHWKNTKATVSGNKRKRKAKDVHSPPKKKAKRTPTKNFAGRTGLRNLGNTCYFNSSVQCLNSTTTFRTFFLNLPRLVPKDAWTAPLPPLPSTLCPPSNKTTSSTTKLRRSARIRNQKHSNTQSEDEDNDIEMEEESISETETETDRQSSLPAPSRLLLRRHTTVLHATMEHDEELSKETPISLSAEVYTLLRILDSGRYSVITPQRLAYSIWNTVPQFCSYHQQDAQEFVSLFLERLESEIQSFDPNISSHYVKKSFECSMVSETHCDECGHRSYYRPPGHYCITLDIYGTIKKLLQRKRTELEGSKERENDNINHNKRKGKRRRGRRCVNYKKGVTLKHRHLSSEKAFDKTLKSYELCSLIDLLKAKNDEIVFCGDNKYECDSCNKKVRAVQRHFIDKIPNVLVFHLCRAYYNLKNERNEKLQNHISFPLKDLRMQSYCFEHKEEDSDASVGYDLVAALVHTGRSMTHGHYVSYCYHRDMDRWLKFDDVRCTVTSEETVRRSQAYLLFYEKQNIASWIDTYIQDIKQQMVLEQ